METLPHPSNQEKYPRQGFFQRNSLSVKIVLIGILILLMFIPIGMIKGLISERMVTARNATYDVQEKWSSPQQLTGPFICLPFYENHEVIRYTKGVPETTYQATLNYLNILPERLEITGRVETEQLKRGLYDVVVYRSALEMSGTFILPEDFNKNQEYEERQLRQASLNIGISDLRGISEQIKAEWGDKSCQFDAGLPHQMLVSSGVSTSLPLNEHLRAGEKVNFKIRLSLKGTESIYFAPLGKITQVNISSNCTTPSFTGSFLPEDRTINENGFQASWKILNLNRNYPQIFTTNQFSENQDLSVFGAELLLPVQQYQQSTRSVKYAFLIIILTFVVSFFTEVIHKKNIHPFQYLLIGLALCLFYTLLIAMSEHIGFNWAYLLAAFMTITLITLYMTGILKIRKTAYTISGLLALLYVYIFILIQMETYALLAGSLGLFVILAIIMYYSQKINWSNPS